MGGGGGIAAPALGLYLGHALLQVGSQLVLLPPEDSVEDGTALAVLAQQEEARGRCPPVTRLRSSPLRPSSHQEHYGQTQATIPASQGHRGGRAKRWLRRSPTLRKRHQC